MNVALRQMRAASSVSLRMLLRMGSFRQLTSRTGRGARGIALTVIWQLYLLWTAWNLGLGVRRQPLETVAGGYSWFIPGVFVLIWAAGIMPVVPQAGRFRGLFANPFFESLPIGTAGGVVLTLLDGVTYCAAAMAGFFGLYHELRLELAMSLGTLAVYLVGSACGRWVRVLLPPDSATKVLLVLSRIALLAGAAMVCGATFLGKFTPLPAAFVLTSAVTTGRAKWIALLFLALGGAGVWAIHGAERRGYDRVELAPASKLSKVRASHRFDVRGVERLLASRENFAVRYAIFTIFLVAANALIVYGAWKDAAHAMRYVSLTYGLACGMTSFMTLVFVFGAAFRSAMRDRTARPLLAQLPILPRDLLAGKAALRIREIIPVTASLLLWLAVPLPMDERLRMGARLACVVGTMLLSTASVAYISFLTMGSGSVDVQASFRNARFELSLVMLPVIGVAAAPNLAGSVIAVVLATLVMLASRHAAHRSVRWLDDMDEAERGTPTWQALLGFGLFQVLQNITILFAHLAKLPDVTTMALAYTVSAAALVAYVMSTARAVALPPWLRPGVWLPFAVAIPVAVGLAFAAREYAHLLKERGVDLPSVKVSGLPGVWFVGVVVLLAPVAEELFFRGWLQKALAVEFPKLGRAFTVLVTAFGFAAVHPTLSFVPVFALGLFAGVLLEWSGMLLPGILAHIVYNGVVTLLGN